MKILKKFKRGCLGKSPFLGRFLKKYKKLGKLVKISEK